MEMNPDLWVELCDCETIIHNLEVEIGGMDAFITMVAGSDADRKGLEQSLNMAFYMSELDKFIGRRDSLTSTIEALEKNRLGEEIPRSPSGTMQVPVEEMIELQAYINEGIDAALRDFE